MGTVAGRDGAASVARPSRRAVADYFRTMGIPVVRGRGFLESDRDGAPLVAVVSEAAARRLWPGQDPIGKRFRFGLGEATDSTEWWTVVGVARDIRYRSLRDATPTLFLPARQSMTQGIFAMRSAGRTAADRDAVLAAIRRALHEVDPDLGIWHPQTMDDYLAGPMAQPRTQRGPALRLRARRAAARGDRALRRARVHRGRAHARARHPLRARRDAEPGCVAKCSARRSPCVGSARSWGSPARSRRRGY